MARYSRKVIDMVLGVVYLSSGLGDKNLNFLDTPWLGETELSEQICGIPVHPGLPHVPVETTSFLQHRIPWPRAYGPSIYLFVEINEASLLNFLAHSIKGVDRAAG